MILPWVFFTSKIFFSSWQWKLDPSAVHQLTSVLVQELVKHMWQTYGKLASFWIKLFFYRFIQTCTQVKEKFLKGVFAFWECLPQATSIRTLFTEKMWFLCGNTEFGFKTWRRPRCILGCPVVDHLTIITLIDNIGKLYGQKLTYLHNL